MQAILEAKHLYKEYEGTEILRDIQLAIRQGEFVAVMGQSGGGKSTLLYNISGMDKATRGEIIFEGKNMEHLPEKEMSRLRLARMGFIFQKANLLKNLSIRDNIIFPGLSLKEVSKHELREQAEALMQRTGIAEIADHDIRKVSGGQLQRAAICRALINQPDILFGDEPTGALNSSATKEVLDIFGEIHKEGKAILLVTHDAKVAARADRVIYLEDGSIKDELELGSYTEDLQSEREQKMQTWLGCMGF